MKKIGVFIILVLLFTQCGRESISDNSLSSGYISPQLKTGNRDIDMAFRIALGDYFTNIQPYNISISDTTKPTILAGLNYDKPWTRDASINSWNAGSFLTPVIARNTLVSALIKENNTVRIGGQYWDAIIWVSSAWNHYLVTGDKDFLELAYETTTNSLNYFERTEFNDDYNLFRGLGWSDGVAAYEGKYANTGGSSAAYEWPKHNPAKVSKPGFGIPMMALSTNCLYYNAYRLADKMSKELKLEALGWSEKALNLKVAINQHLWNDTTGMYKFYIDEEEESNLQETIGNAYALLFGIADNNRAASIINNQYITPAGVPCGWPPLKRYQKDSTDFPRHNAVVWPQIQAFWAEATARYNKPDMLYHELSNLAKHAVRDMQFAEIYHPYSGEIYGGIQERNGELSLWNATSRQTWSATGYIRMILYGIIGIKIDEQGISFSPCIPKELDEVKLVNLKYRDLFLNIMITGNGSNIKKVHINGKMEKKARILNNAKGSQIIEIQLK